MVQEALKEAADKLGYKPLKSDNIDLGGIIPLPDGRKGVVVEEVELCSSLEKCAFRRPGGRKIYFDTEKLGKQLEKYAVR